MKNDLDTYVIIDIQTTKAFYYPDESVVGTVYLQVMRETFPGNTLIIKVKGVEKTNWEQRNSISTADSDNSNTSPQQKKSRKFILYSKQVLHKFEETQFLPMNNFSFPFHFTLLSFIPGTFQCKGSSYQADISYKICVKIPSLAGYIAPLKFKKYFFVRQILQPSDLFNDFRLTFRGGFLMKKQISYLKCYLMKSKYKAGQKIQVKIEIDNSKCCYDIVSIEVLLQKILILQTNKGDVRVFREDLVSTSDQGVKAFETAMKEQSRILTISLDQDRIKQKIQPNTQGALIRCSYCVITKCILRGWFCGDRVMMVALPLIIVPRIQKDNLDAEKLISTCQEYRRKSFFLMQNKFSK